MIMDAGFLEFKLDYAQTEDLAAGDIVHSDAISAGGHTWRVLCYPRGQGNAGDFLSLFLELVTRSNNVKVIFNAFLLHRDGAPSTSHAKTCVHAGGAANAWGWVHFASRRELESVYVDANGWVRIVCGVVIPSDSPLALPPPPPPESAGDRSLTGHLLYRADDTTDVSFVVKGETFRAHRAVLAARSPVFKASLFGSMEEATTPSITLQDVEPAVFRAMLTYMYTDALAVDMDDELGGSPLDLYQHLLAMAERYALDTLKLVCARRLMDNVTVDTVANILACADTYDCPDLRKKCFQFFAVESNFKKAVFTDGFAMLVQQFPSIVAQLRSTVEKMSL